MKAPMPDTILGRVSAVPFTGQSVLRSVYVQVDEATLQEIARRTDGKYFRAVDAPSLIEVYREIDRLERTSLSEERRRRYRERRYRPREPT